MARRQHLTLTVALVILVFFTLSYLFSGSGSVDNVARSPPSSLKPTPPEDSGSDFKVDLDGVPAALLEGDSIAPKLENATLKAELGRATWKFMHTMVARFPDEPTPDDRKTLDTFLHLFGRLYPCGDCARHFRELLAQYPPQTSSRTAAAGWLCFAHNQVNDRLGKPIFDCNNIGDFYDCGCAEDEGKKKTSRDGEDVEEDNRVVETSVETQID